MGQGDYKYEMSQVESQAFQDVREKVYDCVSYYHTIRPLGGQVLMAYIQVQRAK